MAAFFTPTYLCKDFLLSEDDIVTAVEDYITWCSLGLKYRPKAGNLFKMLDTFKLDAIKLFGNIKTQHEIFLSFQLKETNNLDAIELYIKSFYSNNIINNVCATIGLMALAAEYYGGKNKPTNETFKIIGMINSIFDSFDFNLVKSIIINRIN
ncbi:hypothetical protein EPTV-WA-165 [Eptesipox virus]|uniref:Uncharacterized protein n=1 Tax=Eptesipox virus TaxID=1329402 RepID=A0A220T6M9_9POXV|nr:hypothetical protein CG743_gp165 [Eptesipox virus]ASK51366.1 hypothetical protein EPTV-WA-165 [Eptesipox virus]WAH71124.1 hypothetical protein CG743_gp165 [Eptesipox virus]